MWMSLIYNNLVISIQGIYLLFNIFETTMGGGGYSTFENQILNAEELKYSIKILLQCSGFNKVECWNVKKMRRKRCCRRKTAEFVLPFIRLFFLLVRNAVFAPLLICPSGDLLIGIINFSDLIRLKIHNKDDTKPMFIYYQFKKDREMHSSSVKSILSNSWTWSI